MINAIAPNVGDRRLDDWSGVTLDDITGSFHAIPDSRPATEFNCRFLLGKQTGKFIRHRVTIKTRHVVNEKKKEIQNISNAVSPKGTAKMSTSLHDEVQALEDLWLDVILPKTSGVLTAVTNVQEKYQQMTGQTIDIPTTYLLKKYGEASNMVIAEFIADRFNMSSAQRKVFFLEFAAKAQKKT